MFTGKRSQREIFADFDWWNKGCLLYQMTEDRCDYVEACLERVYGRQALKQQEILEIGCGGGLVCEELARRGAVMVGLDPSAQALAVAQRHTCESGLGQNVYYLQGKAEALPFANGAFSAVICLDTLEHVADLRAAIAEVARVLAPGGIFIFDTINRTFLARLVVIWLGEHLPFTELTPGLHDYQAFIRPAELEFLLTASGLQLCELRGFLPRGFVGGRLRWGPGRMRALSYVGYARRPGLT